MQKNYEEAGDAEARELGEMMAWKNDANNHDDYDWQIQELKDIIKKKKE